MATLGIHSDLELQQMVMDELLWDTRVDASEVGVQLHDGTVVLTGTVESWAQRLAAAEAAHRVKGVLDVTNEIRVHVPEFQTRSDLELAQAARHALAWDILIPADEITSTVSDGRITLGGTVANWTERMEAERALRNLPGLRHVTNEIVVEAPAVDSADLRAGIERALARRAERETRRLSIEVDGDTVTLSGTVHNWNEKQAVLGLAGHAPGVRQLVDHLRIDPLG